MLPFLDTSRLRPPLSRWRRVLRRLLVGEGVVGRQAKVDLPLCVPLLGLPVPISTGKYFRGLFLKSILKKQSGGERPVYTLQIPEAVSGV